MYWLTRKARKCNSLVQKICKLLQNETSLQKQTQLGIESPGTQAVYLLIDYFYLNNARELRFHVFLLFHVRKHMTSFCLKWIKFTRNCEFCSNFVTPGTSRTSISCEFGPLQEKWWCHMFSSVKMEGYM